MKPHMRIEASENTYFSHGKLMSRSGRRWPGQGFCAIDPAADRGFGRTPENIGIGEDSAHPDILPAMPERPVQIRRPRIFPRFRNTYWRLFSGGVIAATRFSRDSMRAAMSAMVWFTTSGIW